MKHVLRIAVMLLARACAPAGTSGAVTVDASSWPIVAICATTARRRTSGITVDASPWSIAAMLVFIGVNLLAVAVQVDGLVHLIRWLHRRLHSTRPPV